MNTTADATGAPVATIVVECRDANGNLKWSETIRNIVTTAGKTDIVDKYLKGSAYTAAWFMGLKGTGTPVAGDTLASHAAWTEVTAYASATLPAITFGTTVAGSNTATAVAFSMNASYTVAGMFMSTNNAKGATTGVLYNAADFGTPRSGASGDTLNVTVTYAVS